VIVSHSEVDTYLLCQRRHYYAFGEKLQKKHLSESLQRGIAGHSMMEAFFNAFRDTNSFDYAIDQVDSRFGTLLSPTMDPKELKMLTELQVRVIGYLKYFESTIRQWEVKHVEQTFKVPLTKSVIPGLTFAFTPDLIIFHNGRHHVVDWKFPYNFYGATEISLLPQIPKYISALRMLDMIVGKGYYGMIRYRSLKTPNAPQLYKLQEHTPNRANLERTWKEYYQVVQEIAHLKTQYGDNWENQVKRVGNQLVCRSCAFKELCAAEKDGSDGLRIRKEMYVKSTYGYVESEE